MSTEIHVGVVVRSRWFSPVLAATIAACGSLLGGCNDDGPDHSATVNTQEGWVQGLQKDQYQVFRGIPYAAPPVGDLEGKPPKPHDPWTAMRAAWNPTPACIQPADTDPSEIGSNVQSKDCLTLNVWTPRADGLKRSVLFFIHGGAWVVGSARNPWYDGTVLATRGNVVVVTIQFRLGDADVPFPDGTDTLHLDQQMALTWVHNNIQSFGGDPGNVTLFGESAGGSDVRTMIATPKMKGYFHKAIIESMVPGGPPDPTSSSEDAIIAAGQGSQVPLMVGTNLEEDRYWTVEAADPRDVTVTLPYLWQNNYLNQSVEWQQQFNQTWLLNYSDPFDAINACSTEDWRAGTAVPYVEFYRQHEPGVATFMYLFTYRSPITGPSGRIYGAFHSLELLFAFGQPPKVAEPFAGPQALWGDLQSRMMDAWIAFARKGDPSTPTRAWPVYDETDRATMVFDSASAIFNDPRGWQRQFHCQSLATG